MKKGQKLGKPARRYTAVRLLQDHHDRTARLAERQYCSVSSILNRCLDLALPVLEEKILGPDEYAREQIRRAAGVVDRGAFPRGDGGAET